MHAEMKPDVYAGASCDRVRPQWNCYCEGDKEAEDGSSILKLAARTFPPGTTVVVSEPVCPNCGEGRALKFPTPSRGPLFAGRCDCGFDWDAWTLEQYS